MLRITICLLCVSLGNISSLPQDLELESIGGKEAAEGQFPWQVALFITNQYISEPHFVCGGSIISQEWILTDAYCLNNVTSVRILAGTIINMHDAQDLTSITVEADFWKVHEKFSTLLYDIGIIKLKHLLTFSQNVKAIDLYSQMLPVNTSITLSGWGITSRNFSSTAARLRHEDLVTSTENCERLGDSTICARYDTRKLRRFTVGDSGGAGVIYVSGHPVQVGIASFVVFAPFETMSAFTNVSYFRDWIRQNTMI